MKALWDRVDCISHSRTMAALGAATQQTIESLQDELTNLCNELLASQTSLMRANEALVSYTLNVNNEMGNRTVGTVPTFASLRDQVLQKEWLLQRQAPELFKGEEN
jgi:hypothetical protein